MFLSFGYLQVVESSGSLVMQLKNEEVKTAWMYYIALAAYKASVSWGVSPQFHLCVVLLEVLVELRGSHAPCRVGSISIRFVSECGLCSMTTAHASSPYHHTWHKISSGLLCEWIGYLWRCPESLICLASSSCIGTRAFATSFRIEWEWWHKEWWTWCTWICKATPVVCYGPLTGTKCFYQHAGMLLTILWWPY